MEIGLVVDVACDLPPAFLAERGVEVLPIGIRLGERRVHDARDPARTAAFYRERLDRRTELHAQSQPLEPAEVEATVLERWATRYDHVVCMTITSARSPIYAHTTRAVLTVGTRARELRLRALAERIRTYLVADDLYFVLHRAAREGDRSVSWASYALGNLLDVKPIPHCHRDSTGPVAKARGLEAGVSRVFGNVLADAERGLEVPCVCVSYAGELARLEQLPGFAVFRAALEAAGHTVLVTQMSKTGAVNVGVGSLCVAFAAAQHRFS